MASRKYQSDCSEVGRLASQRQFERKPDRCLTPSPTKTGDTSAPNPPAAEARPPKNKRQLAPPVPGGRFNFGIAAGRLVPVAAAALLLDRSHAQIMALLEEGRLRWAFDLRTAGASRGEYRILGQSLLEFARLCPAAARPTNEDEEFLAVANLVLPPGQKQPTAPALAAFSDRADSVLRGSEVAQCFGCYAGHLRRLIAEKSLQIVDQRREVNRTPLILRASVVEFLRARRVV